MKFRLVNWSGEDCRCFDELAADLPLERAEEGIPLRPGQRVNLRLNNYPDQEFGYVKKCV